ncbi:peptidoglycan DD-metalloendopeptidase family protein [Shinella sp.]|uniref:peptidoglycan DD-metalloendopeptidase family protein n=1 Tax=Shinella sp. TaxID=1870904 RepID=UPI0039E25A00
MRKSVSPSFGRTATRLMAAALLASVATGCSSDASRFGGLFSSSGQDNMTTSSVPRRTLFGGGGGNPVPRGDIGNGGQQYASGGQMGSRGEALNQPFPDQGNISYDPINTATTSGSGTRYATTPMSVQRGELTDPTAGRSAERQASLGQDLPHAKAKSVDTLTTATTKGKSNWSTNNAPVVMLRQGESVKTLANRYGVPEKEILAANGLKRASDAEPGQRIVIPTFSTTASVAKASTDSTLKVDNKLPSPERKNGENVAILPGTTTRDKVKSENGQANTNRADATEGNGKGGYEVQPGDSLAKIARSNGVSVEALKKANGMQTASIRIGQKLVIPAGGAAAETVTDKTVTASVPVTRKIEAAEKKPEAYKAPVKTVSVTEATEKSDVTDAAPESTGIGKYRWPVRGAVIAGYGANVDGNRNDGIDISVPEGTPIKAAENGVVIYAGSSLKELGNAVLVRHDDGTVTVYGHAGDLSVQRGQKIQRGQTVATSGMSGNATRPKVHFEVRKNATPVNPMTFLE